MSLHASKTASICIGLATLAVLERGVREGRRTFANTLKYVFMTTGANFGIFQSHPGRSLLIATLLVVGLTASLPYSPLAPLLGFEPHQRERIAHIIDRRLDQSVDALADEARVGTVDQHDRPRRIGPRQEFFRCRRF